MDTKLEKYLIKKYPLMFPCEKGVDFVFECEDGWFTLIDTLASILQKNINYEMANYEDRKKALFIQQTTTDPNHEPSSWLEKDENGMVIIPPMPEQIVAAQVKQKMGELRFYTEGYSSFSESIIHSFTKMSRNTCELCGKPGKMTQKNYYIQPLCSEHDADNKAVELKVGGIVEFLVDGNVVQGDILKVLSSTELLVLYKKLQYNVFEYEGHYYKLTYIDHPLHAYWDGEPSDFIE